MKYTTTLLSIVVMVLSASSASARPWYAEPAISLSAGYDDNPTLLSASELADTTRQPEAIDNQSFALLGADVRLGSETDFDLLAFDFAVIARRYNESELDSEFARAAAMYEKRGIKQDYGFEAGFSRDSTLETELEDTGILEFNVDRDERFVGTNLTSRFSELLTGDFALEYRDVSFDSSTDTFTDFEDFGGSARLSRIITERFDVFGEVGYLRYLPTDLVEPGDIQRDDLVSLQFGIDYDLTEQVALTLSAGQAYLDTDRLGEDGQTVSFSDNNPVYNLGLDYVGQRNTVAAAFSKTFDSSADGGLSETQSFSLGFSRPEVLSGTLNIRAAYITRDPVRGETDSRDYYALTTGFVRQINQNLSLFAELEYREQEENNSVADITERADASSATIGLRYDFGRKRISY